MSHLLGAAAERLRFEREDAARLQIGLLEPLPDRVEIFFVASLGVPAGAATAIQVSA